MWDSLFFIGWTREQFSEWETRTTPIKIELLDKLMTAADALAQGRRPTSQEREGWMRKAKECQDILAPHIAEIKAMKAASAPYRTEPVAEPEFPVYYDAQGREHAEF